MEESNEIRSHRQSNNNIADGILILNDDCFLHIFKYLSLIDVGNFKEAYASLATVADMEFYRRTRGSLCFDVEGKIDEALKLTEQFGSSATDVVIKYHRLGGTKCCEIFSVIGGQCTEKLKCLSLHDERSLMKEADVPPITDVLKNIETLRNLDGLRSLNGLHLLFAKLDESSITTLARMTRLKDLRLVFCDLPTSSHFESLLLLCGNKSLELFIFLCYPAELLAIDEVNFLQIVEKRKASGAEKCLRLIFLCDESIKSIPLELLEANKAKIKLMN